MSQEIHIKRYTYGKRTDALRTVFYARMGHIGGNIPLSFMYPKFVFKLVRIWWFIKKPLLKSAI